LEYLLSKHGGAMIGKVEAEAKSNPLFAKLLGGVWQNSMIDEVWVRVQVVWNRKGWDRVIYVLSKLRAKYNKKYPSIIRGKNE
jgi:hypothetical protein